MFPMYLFILKKESKALQRLRALLRFWIKKVVFMNRMFWGFKWNSPFPLLIAMPFPGHLGIHRQMTEILQICTDKCIDVHLDCAWLTSAFDINFNFDQPCIKSFAMSFSKAYDLHWNKIGLRWSRTCDQTDSITILNNSSAISKANLYVATRYMQKFSIDHLVKKYKTQ